MIRSAYWTNQLNGGVVPNPGNVGADQIVYGGAVNLTGNDSLKRDGSGGANTGGLTFNELSTVFGIEDNSNNGEPALVVIDPAAGGDVSVIVAGAYTADNDWTGMLLEAKDDGSTFICGLTGAGLFTGTTLHLQAQTVALNPQGASGYIAVTGPIQLEDGVAVRGDTAAGHTYNFQVYDADTGPAYVNWCVVTGGNAPSVVIAPPAGGTTIALTGTTLKVSGDVAGVASTLGLTNATNTTLTNAYTVNGGQAALTSNTGWIKIYVGTAVSWIPYWTNATP